MDTLDESLQDAEVLKSIIKKTIKGICEKGKLYPNICSYSSRSTMDEEQIVTKVFNYMMAEVLPMELTPAINLVDLELGGGFGS
jgi:hypothetical protein